jgi:hypothetical protein
LNRFEQRNFSPELVYFPGLTEALSPHQKQKQRIEEELSEFLSPHEARDTATRVCNLAIEIDEDIDRILKDPLVRRLYDYDGKIFTPRGTWGFHVAFDGLHLLRSLSDSKIGAFFRGREKHFAIRWLLKELGTHAWVAKRLRMNWEESHTLGLVPKEVLEAIIKDASERRRKAEAGPPELSLEERMFFQSYEAQMERQG